MSFWLTIFVILIIIIILYNCDIICYKKNNIKLF